jgi:hypothetical protein
MNDLIRECTQLADKVKLKASTMARVTKTSSTVSHLEQCASALRRASTEIERLETRLATAELALGFPIVHEHVRRAETVYAENDVLRVALRDTRIDTLVWLGYWRDKFPPEAVSQLQDVCDRVRAALGGGDHE